jgi:phosphoesterase RecJ-like protein
LKVPKNLLEFLNREKQFFIATHINPEADALGSSLALSIALESIGKETIVYDKDTIPEFYRFLPEYDRFTNSITNLESGISNLILLDCNHPERAGLEKIKFNNSAVIDHHETEKEFGDIKWIEPKAPATGAMVYYILKELGIKITKDIATNLYSAIAIDTGTFRYTNTTPEVLRIAAELIELGADPAFIAEHLYETWTDNRFRLLMKVLNTIEIEDNVAITMVTQDMFRETSTDAADTENFAGFSRMLQSVKVSALFREIENNFYKVSLRSKGKINVAKIAEGFGGGGHRNAAGYRVRADFEKAKEELLRSIKQVS